MPDTISLDEIRRNLAQFAPPEPAATTPPPAPAPRADLDKFRETLAAFDNPATAPAFSDAKRALDSTADAENALMSVGQPAAPAPVAFDPPASGARDYLYNFSNGRLRLPTNARSDEQFARSRDLASAAYLQNHPGALLALRETETFDAFQSLAGSVTAINTDPPSPEERLTGFDRLYQSWQPTAPPSGTPGVRNEPPPKPDPALARAAYAKSWSTQEGDPLYRGAPPDSLTPDESKAFQALHGGGFFDAARSGLPDTVGRLRGERLLGHPLPGSGPLRFDELAEVSPLARTFLEAGQLYSDASAQQTLADLNKKFHSAGGFVDWALNDVAMGALGLAGKVVDTALLGIPSQLDTSAVSDRIGKEIYGLTATAEDHANANARVAALLRAAPNLTDAEKSHLVASELNAPAGLRSAFSEAGAPDAIARFGGDFVGGQLTPAGAIMWSLGAAGWHKKLKAGESPLIVGPKATAISAEVAESLKNPTYFHTALHADNVQDVALRLAEVPDPTTARNITRRLETQLKDATQPLTNERTAAALSTIEKANQALAELKPNEYLSDSAKSALAELTPPLAELSPYDQALIFTGDVRRAGSEALAAQSVNWLESQANTKTRLDIPANVKDGLAIQEGAIARADRLNEVAARRSRLQDLTTDLDAQLAAELKLHTRQQERVTTTRDETTAAYNRQLTEAHTLLQRLETEGGDVTHPHPALKDPAYPKLKALLSRPGRQLRAFWDRVRDPENLAAGTDPKAVETTFRDPAVQKALGRLALEPGQLLTIARDWVREAETPVTRTVPPSAKPRTTLLDGIAEKLAARKRGEFVALSKPELAALSEHLPGEPLKPPTKADRVWDPLLKDLDHQVADTADLRTKLADLRKKIDDAPADSLRLSVPKALTDRFAAKLDLQPDVKGYAPLFPETSAVELRGTDAFREALSFHKSELSALRSDLLPVTAFEYNTLPRRSRYQIARDAAYSADQARGYSLFKARQFAHQLGRDVSPAESQALLRDLKDGVPRSDASAIILQKTRRAFLDRLLRVGEISPDFYHSLVRSDYYHGVFDRGTRAGLDSASKTTGPLAKLNSRFTPLRSDPAAFKFKIPEDGYYAVWRDKPGAELSHKTDFATPEAASAFLDSLPDTVKEAQVHKAWTFDEKLASGLVGEAGASGVRLFELMGRHIADAQLAASLEPLELIRTPRRLGVPDGFAESTFADADGKRWMRLPDDKGPIRSRGKWISEDAAAMVREQTHAADFFSQLSKEHSEALKAAQANPLLSDATRFVSTLARGAGMASSRLLGALGLSKIALSTKAWVTARLGNEFYSHLAGLPFSPRRLSAKARHMRDYFGLKASGKSDPILDELHAQGFISPVQDTNFHQLAQKSIERNWTSVDGLQARVARVEEQLSALDQAADPERFTALKADHLNLAEELRVATNTAHARTQRGLLETSRAALKAAKDSNATTGLWKLYDIAGGDGDTKYHVARWYAEQGVSVKDAVKIAGTYTQNLHRIPEAVKKITNRFGGAHFVSFPLEQLRILKNAAVREPWRLARLAHALWLTNSAVLAANGVDEDEFLEQAAFQNGTKRDFVSDLTTKLRGVYVPGDHGEMLSFSFIPFFASPFTSDSRAARKVARAISNNTDNAALDLGARGIIGTLSKYALADVGFTLVSALTEGRDEKGDPLTGLGDIGKMLYRMGSPDIFPGNKDWDRFGRAVAGTETDPRTHRSKSLARSAAERFFQTEQFAGSWQQLSAAIAFVQKASGKLPAYQATEKFDDLLTTRVTRKVPKNPDGTYNQAALRAETEAYYRENPTFVPAMDRNLEKTLSREEITRVMSRAAQPTVLTRFHRLSIEDNFSTYAHYRQNNSRPAADVEAPLVKMLDKKLRSKGLDKPSLKLAVQVADDFLSSPGSLPPDALQNLKRWRGAAQAALLGPLE